MRLVIHGQRVALGPRLREYVEQRVSAALARLAPRVREVTIRLSDLNGPRGGIDKRCRIAVGLVPRGTVQIEQTESNLGAAIANAAERASHAVRRHLERWQHRRSRRPTRP